MYLARYEFAGETWVQARIAFSSAVLATSAQWQPLIEPVVGGLALVPRLWSSVRVWLTDGKAGCSLTLTVPATEEVLFRRWLGGFTRVERVAGMSVSSPAGADEHERLAGPIPEFRGQLTCGGFRLRQCWLACDYGLYPVLDSFLAAACAGGFQAMWQSNAAPFEPTPDLVRQARRNSLSVRDLPGRPEPLAALQERLAASVARARFVTEEFVAVDAAALQWAKEWLGHDFASRYGPLGFRWPYPALNRTPSDEDLNLGLHLAAAPDQQPSLASVDEVCGTAASTEQRASVLDWSPGQLLRPLLRTWSGPGTDAGPTPPPDLGPKPPPPHDGPPPFVFVSYSHADLERATPIMQSLSSAGVPLWWDRGIPGGAEWDAYLEDRLLRCQAVVLMLSQRAVDSRWVRREVKFADAINKPLLTIQLEPCDLRHGLAMLLRQYQMIDPRKDDVLGRLRGVLV